MHHLFTFLWSYLSSPISWFMVALGALIGSFLNVCIIRIPEGSFWREMRSHCPSCKELIPFWHNIPILSWFLLRGRAACCGEKISFQYPLVEALGGLLFLLCYWKFPFISNLGANMVIDSDDLLRFAHSTIFCSALLVCAFIDLRLFIIPDKISLPMIALSPVVVYLHPDLDWLSSLIGVVAAVSVFYGIAWLYFLVRKEPGLGMGDVKLLAAIGGWLGYQSLLPTIFISSISGALVGIAVMLYKRNYSMRTAIPFGPFLVLAAILHLLYGQWIMEVFLA